jgi:hypothetical protein
MAPENLTAICEQTVYKNVGASTSHNPIGFQGLLQGQFFYISYYMIEDESSNSKYVMPFHPLGWLH